MPARITVSVLSELLARAQAVTDANRERLLKREADQRADRKRLQAKKAREAEAKRRKRGLDDPTGRNIFTTPALLPINSGDVGVLWYSFGFASANDFAGVPGGDPYPARYVLQLKVASADGQSVQTYDMTHEWTVLNVAVTTSPVPPNASGQQVSPLIHLQLFPAPNGQVLLTMDIREAWAYNWPERPGGTTAAAPGVLLERWGAISSETACSPVSIGAANASGEFALYEAFYPDFADEGSPPWLGRSIAGNVEIVNAPPEVGVVSAFGPTTYAQNSTWGEGPDSGTNATLIYESILTANGLSSEYPESSQGSWPPSTAEPTAPPVDQSALEAMALDGGYSGLSGLNTDGWVQVFTYDFGQSGYVAAQYAALTALPP